MKNSKAEISTGRIHPAEVKPPNLDTLKTNSTTKDNDCLKVPKD